MKMLINGEWLDKKDKIDIVNPYTNEVVDTVPSAEVVDVKKALKSAKSYKNELSAYERYMLLFDVAQKIKESEKEIAELITKESGKPINESLGEIKRSYQTFLLSAEEAKRINGEAIPIDVAEGLPKKTAITVREPLGLVVAITPFNYPLNLVAHKVGPAIAAGNSVVLKPSTETPLTAIRLVEIFLECGAPKNMLNLITGKSSIIGDALVDDSAIDKITFTGSTNAGNKICECSGMVRKSMELGGNDPLIILGDCDIGAAVGVATVGAFGNNGQRCTSIKRIIIEDNIADKFITAFVKESKKWKTGDPMNEDTKIGPIINEKSIVEIEKAVDDAVANGAKLLLGGKRDGNFYPATIVDNVKGDMNLVKHETFGPVAPIIRVKDIDEAIKIANSRIYGLQSGVMTKDIDKAMFIAEKLQVGAVMINEGPGFRAEHIPFGGVKQSGLGREGVKYAIAEMTKIKTIVL